MNEPTRPLRVLCMGSYDPSTPRARQWMRLLSRLGHAIEVHRFDAWSQERTNDVQVGLVSLIARLMPGYFWCVRRLLRGPRPDVIVFLHPGHLDSLILGSVARMLRIPTVFDVFISLHDTLVADRAMVGRRSPKAAGCRIVDTLGIRAARIAVADTPAHAAHFSRLARIRSPQIRVLRIGVDESVFVPTPLPETRIVLFYGTFIPLHGTDTIVRAAAHIERSGITLRMIGRGQRRAEAEKLAQELELANIDFLEPVSESSLADEIAQARVCLGVFGTSAKAVRVVPNKVVQCCAAGRPVVTAQGPAVLSDLENAVVTTPPGDAAALGAAIVELIEDDERSQRLAASGREAFEAKFSDEALAGVLADILSEATA